jgi:hypothetical protein
MFPWMSQIGQLYEEYEMLGCIFEYKTMCGTSNTADVPGLGIVIMATEYDCYDPNFANKRQMEAAEFSSSAVPYETFMHAIECNPNRNVLRNSYVVPGMVSASDADGDERMSVLGNFTIATQGQQADSVAIGELWVTYHVRLSRPILETVVSSAFCQHIYGTSDTTGAITIEGNNTIGGVGFGATPAGTDASASMIIDNTLNNLQGRFLISVLLGLDEGVELTIPSPQNFVYSPGISQPILVQELFPWQTVVPPLNGETTASFQGLCQINATLQNISVPISYSTSEAISWDILITPVNIGLTRRRTGKLGTLEQKLAALEKRLSKDEESSSIKTTNKKQNHNNNYNNSNNNNNNNNNNKKENILAYKTGIAKYNDFKNSLSIIKENNKVAYIDLEESNIKFDMKPLTCNDNPTVKDKNETILLPPCDNFRSKDINILNNLKEAYASVKVVNKLHASPETPPVTVKEYYEKIFKQDYNEAKVLIASLKGNPLLLESLRDTPRPGIITDDSPDEFSQEELIIISKYLD